MGISDPNCVICLNEKQSPEKWTCPCGQGYWNAVKKQFISGGRVRAKQVQSKEEYLEHLRSCEKCRQKAKDDGLVYFQKGFFLPRDDIPLDVIETFVLETVDSSSRVQKATESLYGITTPGYYVFTKNKPQKSFITDLISRMYQDQPTAKRQESSSDWQQFPQPQSDPDASQYPSVPQGSQQGVYDPRHPRLSASTAAYASQSQPLATLTKTGFIGSGLSAADSKGEFRLHEKYNRLFRDYTEDGTSYRQWDSLKGSRMVIGSAPKIDSGYLQSIESQSYSTAAQTSVADYSGRQHTQELGSGGPVFSDPSQSPQQSPTYHAPYEISLRPYQESSEYPTGELDDLSVDELSRASRYRSNEQAPRKREKGGRTPGKRYYQ